MIESLRNVFAIPDLRKRLGFTFAMLAVYRLGCYIPTPGVSAENLLDFMRGVDGTVVDLVNTFTGGSLGRAAVFALGIMPYITSSIIFQLLTVVWPYLEKLSKEGELGRRKITQYTRYLTVGISIVQSTGIALFLQNQTTQGGAPLVPNGGAGFIFITVLSLTTGTAFIMWLGEQITERGIGNGISLIIFAGIIVGFIPGVISTFKSMQSDQLSLFALLIILALMLAVTTFVVYMEKAQRRIPVQYAKRVVGRKVYGGQATYLPLRVNTGGVIPVIFASSILMLPVTLGQMWRETWFFAEEMQTYMPYISYGAPFYYLMFIAAIIFFSYFYVSIIFNPADLAENMRKYGGFIPGIRPGRRTAEYIDRILSRITLVGSLYLAGVSVLPDFLLTGIKLRYLPFIGRNLDTVIQSVGLGWMTTGVGIGFRFGGTSLLIIIGVAMDFIQQVESQLVMRNYDGFMKKGRIRGRRG